MNTLSKSLLSTLGLFSLFILCTPGAFAQSSGSNVGGTELGVDIIISPTDSAPKVAEAYRLAAIRKLNEGSTSIAIQLYSDGLNAVLERVETQTWIYRTAEQGITLADRLTATVGLVDLQIEILDHSLSLIAARGSLAESPSNARELARAQISWFLENFELGKAQSQNVVPRYSAVAYCLVLSNMTRALATDLSREGSTDTAIAARLEELSRNLEEATLNVTSASVGAAIPEAHQKIVQIRKELE